MEGKQVELEVNEMEQSLGEKKKSSKLDIGDGKEHLATLNIAFLQAVEKRKLDTIVAK